MIVDLLRNDMGRVARPGSVAWSDVFDLERYETVWQLTSTVSAELRAGRRARRRVPGAVPVRVRHRRAQGARRCGSSPSWRIRRAACIAARSATWHRRGRARRRLGSTCRSAPWCVDAETGAAEYGVGGGITWDSRAGGRVRGGGREGARCLTARRPRFELVETMRLDPGRRVRPSRAARAPGCRAPPATSGSRFDEAGGRDARSRAERRVSRTGRRGCASALDRRGASTVGIGPLPPVDRRRPRGARRAPIPSTPPTRCCSTRPRCGAVTRKRRPAIPMPTTCCSTNIRGELTEIDDRQRRGAARTGRWLTPPLDCGLLPGVGREVALAEGWLREGVIRSRTWRRADALELVSAVRGRRRVELMEPAERSQSVGRAPGPAGTRTGSPCARPAGRRTAGSGAVPRRRARCARSTGTRLRASREVRRSRSS